MKNYELVNRLMELPAGCDVTASGMMTDDDLHSGGVADETKEEGKIYSYYGNVVDIDVERKCIVLQLD